MAHRYRFYAGSKQRREFRPDGVGDGLCGFVRVQSVGLKMLWIVFQSDEQERQQRGLVLGRERRENLLERLGVLGAPVGRKLHADQEHLGAGLLCLLDHRAEIALHLIDRQAAQTVVCAELENHDRRFDLDENFRHARESTSGGFSRDAGIDDAIIHALPFKPLLEQRDPATLLRDSIGRGKAVSVNQYARRREGGAGRSDGDNGR